MAKKIRYGMVGGSMKAFIGEVHRKAINFDPRVELVAGCFSTREALNKETGETYGLDPERVYASYEIMAKAEAAREDGIDFVSIVTPNAAHYPVAKAFLEAGITSLSGGNQQKVILARWLNTNADLLLMDNPTQGIDVGAKAEIYKLILKLAQEGKTILVNTLEIPELQKVADRCVVFYHGHIQSIFGHDEITEENVMLAATNAINAEGKAVGQ